MPDCSCRGTNPNCCRCGGWGFFGDELSNQTVKDNVYTGEGKKVKRKKITKGRKQKKRKTIASNTLTPKIDTNLVEKKNPISGDLTIILGYIKCPYCSAVLKEKNLKRHHKKVHQNRLNASAPKTSSVDGAKNTSKKIYL